MGIEIFKVMGSAVIPVVICEGGGIPARRRKTVSAQWRVQEGRE
ncbi:hypothetical protein [Xanthomonas translucens]|nr:hypothetical protein [Xanthomonas translucens]